MRKAVWLRIYKGDEILKKENGQFKNENQLVKLIYGTLEWKNYLKGIAYNPYCKVEVEKVLDISNEKQAEIEIDADILKEVKNAFRPEKEIILTPEQIEIAELKAQMAELLGKKSNKPKKEEEEEVLVLNKDEVFNGTQPLDNLKEKYLEKFKKDVPNNKKNDEEWIKNKLNQ
ncbi:MAG: hypothetical protein HQ490_01860 [Lutibacter sp.]|nr:hypothetical protein [Lutibacter sp.]